MILSYHTESFVQSPRRSSPVSAVPAVAPRSTSKRRFAAMFGHHDDPRDVQNPRDPVRRYFEARQGTSTPRLPHPSPRRPRQL